MKIIIAGAGEVGFHLAKMLAHESHDITLIDFDEAKLNYAESHIDVQVVSGNASSIQLLKDCGIGEADLLIAATSIENTNIIVSILGKKLGAARTIARINNPEFQSDENTGYMNDLGIDVMVFPEYLAAKDIHRLIRRSALTDSFEFGEGRLSLTGIVLEDSSELVGKNLIQLASELPKSIQFTLVAVSRNNQTIIPRGDTFLKAQDHVYFISMPECIGDIIKLAGKEKVEVKNVMILGGGLIGRLLAQRIEQKYSVKLVEADKAKCFRLADTLSDTLVIHGDGRDVELLEEEGISDMDAFISVTGNSETNIISCLVAKNHGVKRTIALVENIEYISLSQNIGIDTLINKKLIAVHDIFRFVREGQVEHVTSLHGIESEILEFIVPDNSRITRNPIRALNFPRLAVIAGIVRGRKSYIASGDFEIQGGDHVVVFTIPKAIHEVEKFFK
jgi:trk system potassium uptake protein TrkA